MSHTKDMVMITPEIFLEIFEGEILVVVQHFFFFLSFNLICVKVTADTNRSQE